MGDATSLRSKLTATDLSAPAIQSSASAMMKFYDSPTTAVTEWRNVLQSCQTSQLLPLLYVANEVLQTSKRNRGTKFLEAFGPVLGGSLRFICERDPSSTEKVRRTTKIWGDRRVFSLRFVGDVLAGLEGYRLGSGAIRRPVGAKSIPSSTSNNSQKGATSSSVQQSEPLSSSSSSKPTQGQGKPESSDDDLFGDGADSEEGEDGLAFGDSGPSLLNVSNFAAAAMKIPQKRAKRRHSFESKSPTRMNKKRKPAAKKALSASSFMERINQLDELDSRYQSICNIISSISSSELCTSSSDEIQEVGDELTDLHTDANKMTDNVKNQRKNLYNVAEGKREIETELKRYLVWMKAALSTDEDELKLCDGIEEKLELLWVIHADAKKARSDKRKKEAEERALAEAAAKKKAEEEELKRSLEQIQQEKAPKAGMVWNKQAREYQYLADVTEESWRD